MIFLFKLRTILLKFVTGFWRNFKDLVISLHNWLPTTNPSVFFKDAIVLVVIPKPINNKNVKKKIYQFYKDFSWKLEIDEFAEIIINNSKVKTGSYQDALNVMKMIDKIYTSDTEWYKSLKN